MTPRTATPPPRPSLLARFGPLTAIVLAIALVAVLASTGRGDDNVSSAAPASDTKVGSSNKQLPISWAEAKKAGTTNELDWGTNCDRALGKIKLPSNAAPPCLAARPEVTGGATYQGVTADTIKIVTYEPADDDLSASLQSTLDPPDVQRDTRTKLLQMYEKLYSTWGRKLEIIPFKGTGSSQTASRADAVKVATEIKAFASVGGPGQESAYAEELASRGVLCIGCGLSVPDSTFQKNAPFMWGNLQTPEQYLLNVGDYVVGRLLGRNATFAGDPKLRSKKRVFGVVHFEQDPPVFGGTEELVAKRGAAQGYKSVVNLTYQLVIPELGEKARTLVARLKDAGVTTVIFLGDPIMPIYLTQAATDQNYFPEWFITGTVLTDTTVFGRQYDQKQWAHAFGVSSLPTRVPPNQGEAWKMYKWYYGTDPASKKLVAVLNEPLRILMLGIHMAGPHLTPETFRDGLFAFPPTVSKPTSPRMSFGNHGIFEKPDYLAVDDMVEIWYDAKASGVDEQGKKGKGMMRYANGGKRYLPGQMPTTDSDAFKKKGSVMLLPKAPAADLPPQYPPPPGSPAAEAAGSSSSTSTTKPSG